MTSSQPTKRSTNILLLGVTGSGKSTFANLVSGSNFETEGSLSCTSGVRATPPFELDGRTVTVLDTQGFDDSLGRPGETEARIAQHLKAMFEGGKTIDGIVYLHRISDLRVGMSARQAFRRFCALCGEDSMRRVVLATTMWDTVDSATGAQRERELAETTNPGFAAALAQGARLLRHDDGMRSAQRVLRAVLASTAPPRPLAIQQEMAIEGKTFAETETSRAIRTALEEQEAEHRREIERMQEQQAQIIDSMRQEHQRELDSMRSTVQEFTGVVAAMSEGYHKLQQEMEGLRAVKETLQQRDKEKAESDATIRGQQARIAELEAQLSAMATAPQRKVSPLTTRRRANLATLRSGVPRSSLAKVQEGRAANPDRAKPDPVPLAWTPAGEVNVEREDPWQAIQVQETHAVSRSVALAAAIGVAGAVGRWFFG